MTVGADVRAAARKGPADAVTRVVSEAEAEAAWGGEGGPAGTLEDRHSGRALPTKGIRTVSPGGPNAESVPDARAMANLAARRARAAAAAKLAGASQKPVQPPPPLEDWEMALEAEMATANKPAQAAPVKTTAPTQSEGLPPQTGDVLGRASHRSLSVLAALPSGCELYVGQVFGQEGVELIMGLGYLVGKGYAVYDSGRYRITDDGRSACL